MDELKSSCPPPPPPSHQPNTLCDGLYYESVLRKSNQAVANICKIKPLSSEQFGFLFWFLEEEARLNRKPWCAGAEGGGKRVVK